MKLKHLIIAGLTAIGTGSAFAADVNVIGKISESTTWTADNTYLLDGYVFVTPGATLTIQAGTVVKAKVSSGTGAAALVIAAGAKIEANGTAQNPIIFTSELDDLNGNLTHNDTALWGGVVILGKATINSRADGAAPSAPAQDQIEGFSVTGDDTPLITFGGTDDDDNSGTIRYVSIRHGGAVIGTANEINGLTLGGVGRGTTIEYVEVFANKDDGFEWFGGTVNAKYLVSAFNNDDSFDMDQGFRGNLQFLFAILGDITTDAGDKGIEWDGATSPLTATPRGKTTVANATIIGASTTGKSSYALNIRDAVEATVYNSVFVNFEKMLDVENDVDDGPNPAPVLKNNIFFSHVAANNTAAGLNARLDGAVDGTSILGDATNTFATAGLLKVGYTATGSLDPRPGTGSAAWTGAGAISGEGLVATDYRGAFDDSNWAAGWTKLWSDGYFDPASGVDVNPGSTSKFVNVSARAMVNVDGIVFPGFVITGTQPQTVLIRVAGPQLNGVVPMALADPLLELYSGVNKIAENDDWAASPQLATIMAQVGAGPFEAGSKDSVLLTTLAPGAYTAQIKGKGGAGEIVFEVYEVD